MRARDWVGVQMVIENVGDTAARHLRVEPLLDGAPAPEILAGPVEFDDQASPSATYPGVAPGDDVTVRFLLRTTEAQIDSVEGRVEVRRGQLGARVRVGRLGKLESSRPPEVDAGPF